MIINHNSKPHCTGHAKYEETLAIPAPVVWSILKNFAGWGAWSPFYLSMTAEKVEHQDPKHPVQKRKYRSLFDDVTATPTIEETTLIDDKFYTLKYKMLQNSNKYITSVDTTITLKPDTTGEHTQITWESQSELSAWVELNFIKEILESTFSQLFGVSEAPGADFHPLDTLCAAQQKIYKNNVFGITMFLLLAKFKDDAFNVFTSKLVNFEGQVILGNSTDEYKYSTYDAETENMPKKVAGIPLGEVLPPQKFSLILKRLLEMSYITVSSFYSGFAGKFNAGLAAKTLAEVYGNEQDINLTNQLLEKWDTDEEFAQQLLQGVNPMMIAKVQDLVNQVPTTMQNLSVAENGQETTVTTLAQQGRLFIVDYYELHGLPISNPDMTFYAPYLLLYKELLPQNQSRLNIVGIQLERDVANPIVYTPRNTPKNLWMLAKMFVASADSQIHEFRYHLGQGHLCQEPVVIATHNRIPTTHVIRSLLQPHLDETIGINFLARQTLIASSFAFTNKTFVVGTANGVRLASNSWKNYDFFGSSFPEQLKARGFDRQGTDGLQTYYYRDDGFLLWDAIGNYTTNTVNTYYKTDADVLADKVIQEWAEEMVDPARANLKGFPSTITSKAQLAHVCQVIIWNGSALHSVVNYPQWPYLGFIKNRPNGLYTPMPKPENGQDITEQDIDKALLPTLQSLFQVLFSWLLSSQATETTLPNLKAMNEKISGAFQSELKEMAARINERNNKLEAQGQTPYVFCLPENIACSVNI